MEIAFIEETLKYPPAQMGWKKGLQILEFMIGMAGDTGIRYPMWIRMVSNLY